MDFEERIAALEKENAMLRKQYSENFRQQAAEKLVEKYRLAEDYELFLENAMNKVVVNDGDTISEVADRMYDIIKDSCRRSGVEVPITPREEMDDYIQKLKKKQVDNERYAEQMKKSFV